MEGKGKIEATRRRFLFDTAKVASGVCSKHVFAFGARFSNRRKSLAGAAQQAASGNATAIEVS